VRSQRVFLLEQASKIVKAQRVFFVRAS